MNFLKNGLMFLFSVLLISLLNCNYNYSINFSDNNDSGSSIVFPVVNSIYPGSLITEKIYYIDIQNPAASDSNSGSGESPFKSIRCAYDKAEPGVKIIVKQGIHDERLNITRSGKSNKFIVFQAEGDVRTRGFLLFGDNIAVIGFNITGDETVLPRLC